MRVAIDIGEKSTKICILKELEILDREVIEYKELISAKKLYEKILPILENKLTKFDI
ncbi:hypothetical protein [Spiroplasma taiwanense]|uniref:Uncharacterized protein n=1 Tax=Spiroplasma taiwanense CT-1 TaxID=1276220 RepID=S5LZH2_9MOLU|nr:hypothetical protein [Spiroplasma taiwanense]AGR41107.1 hypothetical protein STAIW_v1c04620 [Spiroplasma taiwanense CT-1]